MSLPISKFKLGKVNSPIPTSLNSKKAPGYDLTTGRVLKEQTKRYDIQY